MVRSFETSWEIISHNVIYVSIDFNLDWKWLLLIILVLIIRTLFKR